MLPGDKSISHRAAIIAALAEGETRIENFATSADCASTIDCLAALGVKIRHLRGNCIVVGGVGKTGLSRPSLPLDCGNSGTTMRLLAGVLAGQSFDSTLTGDNSLRKRPMQRVIDPLSAMGAVIRSADGARAPLTIDGEKPLTGLEYQPPHASAQVKSCVLLAGLNASGRTTVVEPIRTRDHTERMLAWFGADLDCTETSVSVSGDAVLKGRDLTVPGDISSAAFFMIAAACLAGSDISLPNVGVNPSRTAIIDVLRSLGGDVETTEESEVCNEPVATMRICGGMRSTKRGPIMLDERTIANLIDEVPILAVCATQVEQGLEVRGASELRVKESDRIAAVVENLKRMKARVTEFHDGFKVERSYLRGAEIDSYGDHRIAMAFAIAGLLADGETEIRGAECADVSFPRFFETLASVVESRQAA